ncbi:MAG: 4Fe-4S binding protein [archaeon]|nr:4Fe-4S binding protein [archaeon]
MNVIPRISVFLVNIFFNSRYRLASWTRKHPRFGRFIRKLAFDGDDMVVIPKNNTVRRTVDLDIEIKDADERNVVPSDLVKMVLRKSDKIFIMNFCLCRKSNKCKDYPVGSGCIFVGKATSKIPPEYGRFASPEEACAFIDDCGEKGHVHIIGRNKLDSIWLHTGNHLDLMTICNCCPCCCLWNMARDIDKDISDCYRRLDGVTITADTETCAGCGICLESCFVRAIQIREGKVVLDDAKCRGCGRCSESCPTKAITLGFDPGVLESEADRIYRLVNQ